jgi:MFS family permease
MLYRALDLVLAHWRCSGHSRFTCSSQSSQSSRPIFSFPNALAQLAFSIGVFGMALSTLAYGAFADRYGRRPVLLIGLSLFLLGSMISALAGSFTTSLKMNKGESVSYHGARNQHDDREGESVHGRGAHVAGDSVGSPDIRNNFESRTRK